MNLDKWMTKQEITNEDLARLVGVNHSYISLIRHNKRRPSPDVAEMIEKATFGDIKKFDLLYPQG